MQVKQKWYNYGMKKQREPLYDRLYSILAWLFIDKGVPRHKIAKVFRLNKGSLNQVISKHGWVARREELEKKLLRETPIKRGEKPPIAEPLEPLRILHGVNIKLLSKHYKIRMKTIQTHFIRNKVEEAKHERDMLLTKFALLDAVEDRILSRSCLSWVDEETRKKHRDSVARTTQRNTLLEYVVPEGKRKRKKVIQVAKEQPQP